MSADTPSEAEIHAAWQADTLGRVRVSCPATVVSYDPATLTAVVKLSAPLLREDPTTGALVPIPVPPLRMPVCFPAGSGVAITWPLSPGASGLVVFADRSSDGWRSSGAVDLPPQDARRFGLEDGHFIPLLTGQGPAPDAAAVSAASLPALVVTAPDIRLGSATATLPLAMAGLTQVELNLLWAAVHAVNAAIPSGLVAPAVNPLTTAGSVAATKVKGE